MMSEDSDYTSDVNYPLQHQHNMSAHQYGATDRYVIDNDVSWQYYGYYGDDRTPQSRGGGRYIQDGGGYPPGDERSGYNDYYYNNDLYNNYEDRWSTSRHHAGYYDSSSGGYRRHQQSRCRTTMERSDSESEPLSYNSRPQSYYTDR